MQMENAAFCDGREKEKRRESRGQQGRTTVCPSVLASILTAGLSSHFCQKSRAFLPPGALCLSQRALALPCRLPARRCQRRADLMNFQQVNTKHEKAKCVLVGLEDLRGLPLRTVRCPTAVCACSVVTLSCLPLLRALF